MSTVILPEKNSRWRVGILSLGCPKTLVDSEVILGKLNPEKYALAESVAECDIALLNTCAFIQDSQQESIDHILRLIELKREGSLKKLVVVGCLVQRFPTELQKELREVDAFVGTGEYADIPRVLDRVAAGKRVQDIGLPGYLYTSAETRISLTPIHSRYLKISEGCDHTCSFCVIPTFRGRHRSRSLDDVVREAEILVSQGAQELILTGQDTTFYGYDLKGRYLLPELLRRLDALPGVHWIRTLYAYPSLVSDELIDSMANLKRVCHYLDMPLQHVSDRVLKSMRRGTTHMSTRRLISKLRERIPDLSLRTTFIVGYPGETEQEFTELLDFMKEARFERLGIFTYSPEKGSGAEGLPAQVSEDVKQKRLERGMLLQQDISRQNNSCLLGKTLEVLVEEWDAKGGRGRTYMDAPEVDGIVSFLSPQGRRQYRIQAGQFVQVRITRTKEYDLVGELVSPLPV